MATAVKSQSSTSAKARGNGRLRAYLWIASVLSISLVMVVVVRGWNDVTTNVGVVIVWTLAAAVADLFAVRLRKSITLTMSFTVTLAAAMVLAPAQAALVAFFGSIDRRELRGELSLSQVLFNRGQVACATTAAALVFAQSPFELIAWPAVLIWALLGLGADFLVNAAFVVSGIAVRDSVNPQRALRVLFGTAPIQTIILYVFLGCMAPLIGVAYTLAGVWGLAVSLMPVWLARQSLERTESLGVASSRLAVKDEAIRQATDRVVEERRDERMALAGELHDEVLPALFKVHLMGQVLKQDLASGQLLQLEEDMPALLEATLTAQAAVRRVVGSLRSSPIGSNGLEGAIRSIAHEFEASGSPRIELDLSDVAGSERAKLVVFQVAREALANAAKYSQASRIWVRVWSDDGLLRLSVADDGTGFEISRAEGRPSHYGLQLMRERVEATGGSLVLDVRLGEGVTVSVAVPPDA